MKFKTLINSVKIPVLGIGTWQMGERSSQNSYSDQDCINAIRKAIKLGITHIDTAETYAEGRAEELVGKAIKGINRKKLFITTKVWKDNLRYRDVISALKRSLKRLNIRYIDLYLVHWPNPKTPLKETMAAMDFLVEKKLVRFIGVSNFSVELLRKAQSYAKNKIVANQVEYNLLKREPEDKLLDYCQRNDIMLVAYQPLVGGRLARPGFKALDEVARKYNKTQAQIAINWLISKHKVVTIPKSANIKHLKENLGALNFELKEEDIKKLDKYFLSLCFYSKIFRRPILKLKRVVVDWLPHRYVKKLAVIYRKVIKI